MNRRSFLASLIPGAIALTDPEELIWKPLKTIFIPPATIDLPLPVTVDKMWSVDFEFSDEELLLTIDDFRMRYIEPALNHYMRHL